MPRELPSFDLVVATVGRTDELAAFLRSVGAQEYPAVRVLVVDQNEDERLAPILADLPVEVVPVSAPRGLSRARNAALPLLKADVVAFPDDDCAY
ncbi:MAG TPA: glycosyltransferase family A protein, partial [Gaiellaceae bacterium]|nr:glycosyltransferase family A protein [Gaiellaceae bacterium]